MQANDSSSYRSTKAFARHGETMKTRLSNGIDIHWRPLGITLVADTGHAVNLSFDELDNLELLVGRRRNEHSRLDETDDEGYGQGGVDGTA